MKQFTKSELIEIFEVARIALDKRNTRDYIGDTIDLSEDELLQIRNKLNLFLNNID